MIDTVTKKQKKGSFSEEDVCTLLQKYSATQVLALLREVAQSQDVKIDWNALVKKTSIGIENARECQMLWRHLAYRQPLLEKIEAVAQPLDDDSDLEYELEASPPVSTEVAMETVNCVKVLALGSPNESSIPNSSTIEGDKPNGHSSQISSEHNHPSLLHSSSMSVQVSAHKQPQPAGISGEGLDANGATNNNYPSRRKRKPWSEEEDLILINSFRKYGEGIWATIAKAEFNGSRTASQLSQRWAILRKKQGGMNVTVNGSQLSQLHLDTRHALEQALKNTLTAGCATVGNGTAGTSNPTNLNASNKDSSVTSITMPSPNTTSVKPGPMGPMSTPRHLPKKAPAKPSVTVDSIQATAVAVGARIASPSDAESLFKAAQAKTTVHISTGSLPPNVHFIRTGLATAPPTVATGNPSYSAGGHLAKGTTVKPPVPTASVSHLSGTKMGPTERIDAVVKVPGSDTKPTVEVLEDSACLSRDLPREPHEKGQPTSSSKQKADDDDSQCAKNKILTKTEPVDEVCKPSSVQESGNPSVNVRQEVSPSLIVDGGTKKMEVSSEALSGAEKTDPMEL